jgi:hypothetical protein
MASSRLKILIAGLKRVLGEEETDRILSNSLIVEEIIGAAKRHPLAEIEAALRDAETAGAARWAWIAQRLRNGPQTG